MQVAGSDEQHLRSARRSVAVNIDPRDTGQMQPAGRILKHRSDTIVAVERSSIDQELSIRGEQLDAPLDIACIKGQCVGGDQFADRGVVVVHHCPLASRRCSIAPRRSACDSAARVIIWNPSSAMA